MHAPKLPPNESTRLRAVERQRMLDTPPEAAFDDLAKLAAYVCGTPIALITLMDENRQWFKAKVGVPEDFTETLREISFCGHMVYDGQPMLVPNTSNDVRFRDNPLVIGMGVRFYAGQPLTDDDGHTLGSICVLDHEPRQLTPEQKTALAVLARQVMSQIKYRSEAAALAASQALMKRYFTRDDVWMGIAEYDGTTIKQVFNNPRTQTYFTDRGLDPSRVGTRDDYVPAKSEWFRVYAECARTRSRQTFEFEAAPDGVVRVLRATIHYIGLSEQGHPQMSFMVDDVTEQRAAERLIDQQRQVVVHSSKLSALGEMAAGMAHEINNPLAIIGGRAQEMRMLLKRSAPTEKLLDSLASIERTVERISKIIRGLRSFARDASQDPMVRVKIGDVLQDTLAFCAARFHAHGVHLEIAPPPPDVDIQCRPAEVSQVLLNLLNNAHDAVEGTGRKPWVRVDVLSLPDAVEVAVTDSGSGIAEELREKIMQPFFTTKAVNKGTGLGLSIAKGIVEAHGGTLTVDTASVNTRFLVRLPRAGA